MDSIIIIIHQNEERGGRISTTNTRKEMRV